MEKPRAPGIEKSLEELIAAAGELAFQYSENGEQAVRIARQALIELLKNASRPKDEEIAWNYPTSNYLQ
jgi:hypothetical protein